MKKVISGCLALSILALTLTGCQYKDTFHHDTTEFVQNADPVQTSGDTGKSTSPVEESSNSDLNPSDFSYRHSDSPDHNDSLKYFMEIVEKNPYDEWLKTELATSSRMPEPIYADYLAFWQKELEVTLENAKKLFCDEGNYNQMLQETSGFQGEETYERWKRQIEQWEAVEIETLKIEYDLFNNMGDRCEIVIIPRCDRLRQKVIDIKWFLYEYEMNIIFYDTYDLTPCPVQWFGISCFSDAPDKT